MFQYYPDTSCMPPIWKVGLIKLVPKMVSPMAFHTWRIISFIGGLYKAFTKVLANKVQNYMPKLIQLAQYGFIAYRNICCMMYLMLKWPWIVLDILHSSRIDNVVV